MKVLLTVKSMSTKDLVYEIRQGKDDKVYCTCPAWKFSKPENKTCKHLRRYKGLTQAKLKG